eukprot:7795806-Alexandrium_andersonii.AAC.1
MSASLVGSEMCIRDRRTRSQVCHGLCRNAHSGETPVAVIIRHQKVCLLYTSDAADICSV